MVIRVLTAILFVMTCHACLAEEDASSSGDELLSKAGRSGARKRLYVVFDGTGCDLTKGLCVDSVVARFVQQKVSIGGASLHYVPGPVAMVTGDVEQAGTYRKITWPSLQTRLFEHPYAIHVLAYSRGCAAALQFVQDFDATVDDTIDQAICIDGVFKPDSWRSGKTFDCQKVKRALHVRRKWGAKPIDDLALGTVDLQSDDQCLQEVPISNTGHIDMYYAPQVDQLIRLFLDNPRSWLKKVGFLEMRVR